ncbi:MAG: hypothetical protein KTR30_25060 [Saprospiraceae bacterium]|nr:hypothetical protein [Saprospiraceae bacterium]
MRIRFLLESSFYLILILVSSFVIYRQLPALRTNPPISIGQKINSLDRYSQSEGLLLIPVSAHCQDCLQDWGLYKDLIVQSTISNGRPVMLAMDQVQNQGALLDSIYSSDLPSLPIMQLGFRAHGIQALPTIISLDKNARVAQIWSGGLLPDAEAAVKTELISSR